MRDTFATFTLAVNRANDKANFYSVVVWGPTAQTGSEAIKKGDKVFVEGTLNPRPYTTKLKQESMEIQVLAEQWLKI